jgi:hypothetical protein
MSNILRRLRKLKTRLTDNCGLAPHSEGLGDPSAQAACRIRHNECSLCSATPVVKYASPTASPGIPSASPLSTGRYRACSKTPKATYESVANGSPGRQSWGPLQHLREPS